MLSNSGRVNKNARRVAVGAILFVVLQKPWVQHVLGVVMLPFWIIPVLAFFGMCAVCAPVEWFIERKHANE